MPSHQRRSSSRRQGRVGETRADRQDQDRPVTLSSLRPARCGRQKRRRKTYERCCCCVYRLTCISGAPAVPGSLVSRQLSCLLASGVQDRSREAGWRLMMPARAWFESGLHLLTSMWLQRRLSQLLQRTRGGGGDNNTQSVQSGAQVHKPRRGQQQHRRTTCTRPCRRSCRSAARLCSGI